MNVNVSVFLIEFSLCCFWCNCFIVRYTCHENIVFLLCAVDNFTAFQCTLHYICFIHFRHISAIIPDAGDSISTPVQGLSQFIFDLKHLQSRVKTLVKMVTIYLPKECSILFLFNNKLITGTHICITSSVGIFTCKSLCQR
jgi:hypothetical protein